MTRIILAMALALAAAGGVFAQETQTAETQRAETQPAETTTAESETATTATAGQTATAEATVAPPTSWEIRNRFTTLIQHSMPELGTILVLDPSLLTNEEFLAGHPELARFVAEHPEVTRHPRFYLGHFENPRTDGDELGDVFEALMILGTIGLIAFALAWLLRTIIEQKRWNRLSRTQTEVHNKILDRFASSEELLQYVKSPAGAKFLESAPIPVRTEQASPNAPVTRIIWSIHLGIIVAIGGLGTLLVSLGFEGEDAQSLFVLGAIAFCLGLGFIASAVVSIVLSRRLGLWQAPASAPGNVMDSSGVTR